MQETTGVLDRITHHDKLPITVNENCVIALPEDVLHALLRPHKLAHYCFVFMDRGTETYKVDLQNIAISDHQLVFGLPNQIFTNPVKSADTQNYKIGFDENTLALLPQSYPFLFNPLNTNTINFDPLSSQRVKIILSILFQLLHATGKQQPAEIILAHLNTLLTEFNSAYFQHASPDTVPDSRMSKFAEFKLVVETHLTEQQDVHTIAESLAMTTSSLYSVVKEVSGLSPKEWMTHRLMLEAQRKLHYSPISVKELAYELGFNDPDYFSRLFKKSTGRSVSAFLGNLRDLSSN